MKKVFVFIFSIFLCLCFVGCSPAKTDTIDGESGLPEYTITITRYDGNKDYIYFNEKNKDDKVKEIKCTPDRRGEKSFLWEDGTVIPEELELKDYTFKEVAYTEYTITIIRYDESKEYIYFNQKNKGEKVKEITLTPDEKFIDYEWETGTIIPEELELKNYEFKEHQNIGPFNPSQK